MFKIGFFGVKDWEVDYLKKGTAKIDGATFDFIADNLNPDNATLAVGYDALSVFIDSVVDKRVIDSLQKTRLITTRSTGYDHIDVTESGNKGIAVSNVPSYGENTVAEFAFGLMLTLSRKIFQSCDQIKETGSWSTDGLRGFDLKGKTLGVIGTGRIGRNMVKMARGFDMKVVGYDSFENEALKSTEGFEYVSLDELLSQSDIVTVHLPYLPETHHLLNLERLSKMKKGAFLVNTSRGAIVETEALVKVLKSGHLGGAGLDVLEEEGVIKDELDFLLKGHPEEHNLKTVIANHLLVDMPNVIMTPHNAFNSKEAMERILDTTVENLKEFVDGKIINQVK